jgi:hydrogenase nickel incorporation protein HypA/HybF
VHEQRLIRDVVSRVEAVARAEGATRVTHVRVRLGALSHFTSEHFREHFVDAARGTLAEGALVDATVEVDIRHEHAGEVMVESVEVELPGGRDEEGTS